MAVQRRYRSKGSNSRSTSENAPIRWFCGAGDGNRTRVASLEVLYAPEHVCGTALAAASP